ncbi:MAG: hypothetical protein SGI84_01700 [Gemmatimonadota bacterium]|nr:hypothetical protein [Gemmatimonadota bacterium]
MSNRLIWIALGIVAAVLVGVSALASPGSWQAIWAPVAAYPWQSLWAPIAAYPWQAWYDANLARTLALVYQYPVGAAVVGGMLALVPVALVVRWVRRPRQPKVAMLPFSQALEHAMTELNAAPAARPRKRHVAELALAGHPVAEIARTTRLSQDAVRALLARRT